MKEERSGILTPPICLTIAGSDPSGGAGIQADLKTFAALGCYGAAAISAITVQNTLGVRRSVPVAADLVAEQSEAVLVDLEVRAVKVGMMPTAEISRAVARLMRRYVSPFLVVDPILISSSGLPLTDVAAREAMLDEWVPICDLFTPNVPELKALTHTEDIAAGVSFLLDKGCGAVLVKGGHLEGQPVDTLYINDGTQQSFAAARITTRNDHGTGCTLSSAIAALAARGYALQQAVSEAKHYVTEALQAAASLNLGHGHGALWHSVYHPISGDKP